MSAFMDRTWCSHVARVLLGLIFWLAPGFAGTAFPQSAEADDVAKHLSKQFIAAHIRRVIAADFIDNGGGVTLQGAFLADWFLALLEPQNAFQTFDRSPMRRGLYSQQIIAGAAFEKVEMDAARGAGAHGLIMGRIEQHPENLSITISALNLSTGQKIEQRTISVPRTRFLDDLASQSVQPNGPIYLVGQNGVSTPRCLYCPVPLYTEAARKKKLQGHVVLSAIIEPSGRADKIWEVRGLSDGLTEEAIEIVRRWRFGPAQDANGKSVAVMVPLEVTFQ